LVLGGRGGERRERDMDEDEDDEGMVMWLVIINTPPLSIRFASLRWI
jgi:hypothetical protein